MLKCIDLSGQWSFALDKKKEGAKSPFNDTIFLPSTTSYSKKGEKNEEVEIAHLTDKYKFEGYAWFLREFEITEDIKNKVCLLYLERTRITTVWIDGIKIGTRNSLCTPHVYDISENLFLGKHNITICVDNTNYPTKGGHLTSADTQTNWNGIIGKIELQIFNKVYLRDVQVYPEVEDRAVNIKAKVNGIDHGVISVFAESYNSDHLYKVDEKEFAFNSNDISIKYYLGENALLWNEYEPNLYKLTLKLKVNNLIYDTTKVNFGLREFKANGDKFIINGAKTFLRGKHDGMIFPKTGFAPASLNEWLRVMKISKSYGINHYRFHTCCPPDAAFEAADLLGIYMEPELPFWGTVTDEGDEGHNKIEQDFLVNEGVSILHNFGNHPSFVMMSLGNELWGSKKRMAEIIRKYKEIDNRHLYTEGSNNFQFTPVILKEDDFFCGVRFSKNRLIRGSYAMCDAPLGHVQTDEPSTMKDYDKNILQDTLTTCKNNISNNEQSIEIQFGTQTKTVKTGEVKENLVPRIPVVSHEIGQYETYPNFKEILKYTGPVKAKNLEVFKKRLEDKGLYELAEQYFECSGKLAVQCYKEELEAAFRSRRLAGFQVLDIQDFSGQGTALVGILDAFMDSKGLISPEEWRSFCSDAVLLGRFEKYNFISGETFKAHIELSYYRQVKLRGLKLVWKLKGEDILYEKGEALVSKICGENFIDICDIKLKIPKVKTMKKLTLSLEIIGTDIFKNYDLWAYPEEITLDTNGVNIFNKLSEEAINLLKQGESVVLFPEVDKLKNSIEGFYCTDFWCYPMFRSISESMNRKIPVGTMGLLIDNNHPIFKNFVTEKYSTYQWWSIVSNSCSIILDDLPKDFRPIVQTIDNFERNHKLGLIFEGKVFSGKLLVCSFDFDRIKDRVEGKQLLFSIFNYVKSNEFNPKYKVQIQNTIK